VLGVGSLITLSVNKGMEEIGEKDKIIENLIRMYMKNMWGMKLKKV
jgi:hypothetical protein